MAGVSQSGLIALGQARRGRELVVHLALREVAARHRFTLLGWLWPVARQLAQLAVLVFVFSGVVDLGIPDYPAFVFSGLIAWGWFSAGIAEGAGSLLAQRHLVFTPRFPTAALPVVPVAVAMVDVLLALPILLALLAGIGEVHLTLLFLPLLLAVQLGLMAGLAWLAAALTVFLRDVRQLVLVALTLMFYLTPVFYDPGRVPERFRWVLDLNPMSVLVQAYRDVLLDGRLPPPGPLLAVAAGSAALAAVGLAVFRRLQPAFVDEL